MSCPELFSFSFFQLERQAVENSMFSSPPTVLSYLWAELRDTLPSTVTAVLACRCKIQNTIYHANNGQVDALICIYISVLRCLCKYSASGTFLQGAGNTSHSLQSYQFSGPEKQEGTRQVWKGSLEKECVTPAVTCNAFTSCREVDFQTSSTG